MDSRRRAAATAPSSVTTARRVDGRGRARHPAARLARGANLLVALAVIAAGLFLAPPSRAWAHADLVGTAPGNGEHLDAAPAQIRLRFTERVNLVTDAVTLFDSSGARLDTPPARLDGEVDVVLDMPPGLGDDVYSVVWRVVSADSHPVHGTFVFSVGDAVAEAVVDAGAQAGADPALGAVFWIVRLLAYGCLALFAGGLLFLALCWPAGWSSPRAWTLVLAGWGLSLACAVAVMLLQGPYAAGASIAGLADIQLLRATVASEYGAYVMARLALLTVAGAMLLLARRLTERAQAGVQGEQVQGGQIQAGRVLASRVPVGLRWIAIALAVVAVPATWPGTGHANASGPLAFAATTVHVMAMVSWLGGLAMLFTVLPRYVDDSPTGTARTLSRFSRLAMVCVGVLVVTGTYQAWRGLGGGAGILDTLAGSSYGALLVFKLAILAVLLTVAALSRSLVTRYYAMAPAATATEPRSGRGRRRTQRAELARLAHLRTRLHRAVGIEAGIGAAILALTSVLVATPPGRPEVVPVRLDVPLETQQVSTFAMDRELSTGGTMRVVIDPLQVGTTRLTVDVTDEAGDALDVPEVTASLSLAERELGPVRVELARTAPGRYAADAVTIPFAGTWQVRVTVRTTDFDQTTLVTDLTISPKGTP